MVGTTNWGRIDKQQSGSRGEPGSTRTPLVCLLLREKLNLKHPCFGLLVGMVGIAWCLLWFDDPHPWSFVTLVDGPPLNPHEF